MYISKRASWRRIAHTSSVQKSAKGRRRFKLGQEAVRLNCALAKSSSEIMKRKALLLLKRRCHQRMKSSLCLDGADTAADLACEMMTPVSRREIDGRRQYEHHSTREIACRHLRSAHKHLIDFAMLLREFVVFIRREIDEEALTS